MHTAATASSRRYLRAARPRRSRGSWLRVLGAALPVLALFLLAAPSALAAEPRYLNEMPTTERVLQRIEGSNRLDTWARQYAAFERLVSIMGELQGPRAFDPTPAEARVASAYRAQIGALQGKALNSVPLAKQQALRREWFPAAQAYETSAAFNRQLMTTFFTASFLKQYARAFAASEAAIAKQRESVAAAAERTRAGAEGPKEQSKLQKTLLIAGVILLFILVSGAFAVARLVNHERGWIPWRGWW